MNNNMASAGSRCLQHSVGNTEDVNGERCWGWLAFMLAVGDGHVECVKILMAALSHTALLDAVNKAGNDGLSALMLAAKNGHVECIRCLLDTGLVAVNKAGCKVEGNNALMLASEMGHVECIKCLLNTGLVDLNMANNMGKNALMIAAQNGHVECLKCLLNTASVELNMADKMGTNALMLASWMGHVECVKCLLATGLTYDDIKKVNRKGKNALMLASTRGHVECVKCLLGTELVIDINRTNMKGHTALMLAANNGHVECIRCLLHTGLVDVNKASKKGNNALMLASWMGHVDSVKRLLDTGLVDVNMANNMGKNALMIAAQNGHVECLKCLLNTASVELNMADKMGTNAFMLASWMGHVECVKCLLATGLIHDDIKKVNRKGKNALMLASTKGHVECVKCLLETNLVNDINRTNMKGYTALMLAAKNGHVECIRCLLHTGLVDVNKASKKGNNALMLASWMDHFDCVKRLLDTGLVDLNMTDNMGKNALMIASKNGHVECVKCFLDTCLTNDIKKVNHKGKNALMLAARRGRVECVECLLDTDLVNDINRTDMKGLTALMLAANHGHIGCVKCLLNTGLADSGIHKKEGQNHLTALALASQGGHLECVQFLLDAGKAEQPKKMEDERHTAFLLAILGGHVDCLRCFLDISVVDEIPAPTHNTCTSLGSNSKSLFIPNDSVTWFTYTPDITWTWPYVSGGRDPERQSILKLVVGRGEGRCVVCYLLGNLDVPCTRHCACHHDGLVDAATGVGRNAKTTTLGLAASESQEECMDYVLQCERIRLHTLAVLLRDEFEKTATISLVLHNRLCHLIWHSDQVDRFLCMLCDGSHLSRCVDFLLSTLICQKDQNNVNTLEIEDKGCRWKSLGMLLQHTFVQNSESLPDFIRDLFLNPPNEILKDNKAIYGRLSAFIGNGFFVWNWYIPAMGKYHNCKTRVSNIARALVINGYSPGEFEWQGKPSSPLHHAFMIGDEGLARYLVANFYLTGRDMNYFQINTESLGPGSGKLRNLQSLHRQIFGTPWRLEVLSFVKVSSLLQCKTRQENTAPVGGLPIPQCFKKRLSFVNEVRLLDEMDSDLLNGLLV